MSIGFTAVLLGAGVAVGTGVLPTPLSDSSSTAKAPAAALLDTTPVLTPSVNSFSYAVASVPASLRAHPKTSPAVKHTKKPKPAPSASLTTSPAGTPTPTQPPAPTPTAVQPVAGSGMTPQATAEYETPKGDNQKAWSEAILTAVGAPLTSANIVSIGYWMQNEAGSPPYGIVGANNPINVSEPCCGGVGIQDDGDGVTFLQSYPTAAAGIQAIAEYLNRGNYTQMLADLKAGAGLSDPNLAGEIGLYSGGGYTTIPDSFGQSQGAPES
ncbi:MAG TPA: hypothetical protein VGD91_25435 [Trebonia sp.]